MATARPPTTVEFPPYPRQQGVSITDSPKRAAILVAAIDFGTTYSGYAYSFRNKPEDIRTNSWEQGKFQTPKTSTVLLLYPDRSPSSFGDEALTKYRSLSDYDRKEWYLFERFKMQLYNQDTKLLDISITVKDVNQKELPALEVFSKSIALLKAHLEKELRRIDGTDTTTIRSERDIHWVLTVPAIWEDLAKKFMRDAAIQAGIPDEMLTLALEPEAASVWCQRKFGVRRLPIGCKYTLVDLGGGTGDITCHEKLLGGRLKELLPPTGGPFGGNEVNNNFIGFLKTILGNRVLTRLKEENATEYGELLDRIELKKRTFDGSNEIRIKLPYVVMELFEAETRQSLKTSLRNGTQSKQGIRLQGDKLHLSATVVNGLFSKVVTGTKEKVRAVVDEVNPDRIILAGGFSASRFVQREIKANFDKKVKVPKDPELAVLKGAVLYGHRPSQISCRRCKYTYGIARMMKFKQWHDQKRKVILNGIEYVDNLFNKHIEVGEEVNVEEAENAEAHEYFPSIAEMKQAVLDVYASSNRNPMYVDEEGCRLVGLMRLEIDPQGDIFSKILVKIIFGGTELVIEARDVKNDKVYRQSLDFFG